MTDLGRDEDLDGTRLEEPLDNPLVLLGQGLMVEADSVSKRLAEAVVRNAFQMRGEVILLNVEEPLILLVGKAVAEDVRRRELALLPRGHERNHGLLAGPVVDG